MSTSLEYITNFGDLLTATEPQSPEGTLIKVFRLPATKGLQDRFVQVVAGPDAATIQTVFVNWTEQFCDHVAQVKAGV